MSDNSDEMSSPTSISSDEQSSGSDSSQEMEIVGHVQPYADEPLAHSSDEDDDAEEGHDGLSPATLRARYEGEEVLNEWLVFSLVYFSKLP